MSITPTELKSALKSAQTWWDDMGVDVDFPVAPINKKRATPPRTKPQAKPKAPAQLSVDLSQITAKAQAATTLNALKDIIAGLDVGDLSDAAQNTVFAKGNPQSALMCIGELPRREDIENGQPFAGQAGQVLDKMLASIDQTEDNTYITNFCNWRTPGDRNLSDDEIALCRPLITRHIELKAPKIIVIIGGQTLTALTEKTGIMKTRGQWQTLNIGGHDIPAMPIYRPSFLLRRPELKKHAWRDLLAIKEKLTAL